ncbi:hypothetical protein B2J88_29155 [Rhodococcus sp. SRB_17]|uniref:hypothetical protein n=1 Tax=Rhodococcus sp. OK302 TaxID=1882769 RepID=UPI000B9F1699|nr:hypothetical protein [Rhodococcus sp. OK302]NMM88372.1 hypothetical protein [Rhodococcus sp. SRB_17]OYD71869.1 hypothetical protein BDB13_5552 [Rhodococcus sp. OK302]
MKRSIIVALASATIALGTVASASAAPSNLAAPTAGGSSGSVDFFYGPPGGGNSGSTDLANSSIQGPIRVLCFFVAVCGELPDWP